MHDGVRGDFAGVELLAKLAMQIGTKDFFKIDEVNFGRNPGQVAGAETRRTIGADARDAGPREEMRRVSEIGGAIVPASHGQWKPASRARDDQFWLVAAWHILNSAFAINIP